MPTETRKIQLMKEVAMTLVGFAFNISQSSFDKWKMRFTAPVWNKEEENWISENLEIELGEVKRIDIKNENQL